MSDATTTQPCDCENDICEKLRKEIDDLLYRNKRELGNGGTHGLVHRFAEQINGQNGPGTSSWQTHEDTIKNQQEALRKRLREWDKNNCGDPPPNAWQWASRPVPQTKEWKDPGLSTAQKVVVGGAATIGAGYIIYRVIRFIPSLFPPLWGTIPANAAIP